MVRAERVEEGVTRLCARCADGRAFREAHSEAIRAEFAQWVENIAAGKSPIGFFKKLGELLRACIADMQVCLASSKCRPPP